MFATYLFYEIPIRVSQLSLEHTPLRSLYWQSTLESYGQLQNEQTKATLAWHKFAIPDVGSCLLRGGRLYHSELLLLLNYSGSWCCWKTPRTYVFDVTSVGQRKYVFYFTSIGQRSSPWTCNSVKVEKKFHLEYKLHFPSARLMLRQMHLTNYVSESIEAKHWVSWISFNI